MHLTLLSLARAALACACILPFAARAQAAEPAALRALADRTIRPLMEQYGLPGMAVGITAGGQAMFFNYGVASTQDGAPVTEHTLFELGSISKTFAAALALHAEAQGKLSLDDHPGAYLPALKGSAIDHASLRHFGTYTAGGLPLQFPEDIEDMAATMAYFGAWRPDAAPGTMRRYSNPSIGLLGQATAAALNEGFGEAFEGRLLPALGLRDTYVVVPPAAMARYAWGVDAAGKPARVTRAELNAQAYGIKSSAADMVRYLQANIEPSRLAGAARRAVEGTHVGYYRVGEMVQGLGWEQYRPPVSLARLLAGNAAGMIHDPNPASAIASGAARAAPAGTLFNKTGSTRGFSAYALFVPDRKIGIVLLADKNFPIPARIEAAHALLEALNPGGGQ